MPRIRGKKPIEKNDVGQPSERLSRERARAKAKPPVENEPPENTEDQETEDVGKTLHMKDGMLGFVSNKGFTAATNFVVDIESQAYSLKYSLKGQSTFVHIFVIKHMIL